MAFPQKLAVYDIHHQTFAGYQPKTPEEWIERAARVAEILTEDAVQRDIQQVPPHAEVALLKSSGLTTILGPTEHGGGGQTWDVGYKVIREVAKGDGYIRKLTSIMADENPGQSVCF